MKPIRLILQKIDNRNVLNLFRSLIQFKMSTKFNMETLPSQDDISILGRPKTRKWKILFVLVLVFFVFVGAFVAFLLIRESHDEVTAIFFTCCNRYSHFNKTLQSFFTYNDYPLKKIIILNDGQNNPQLQSITDQYKNITVIHTVQKVGQIMAVDTGFNQVTTQYVFHSEDDWQYIRSGIIEMNIKALKQDRNLLQTWNRYHAKGHMNECGILDNQWDWGGFSFNPSVLRISDWKQIKGGFVQVTNNSTYGKGAGFSQLQIIKYFKHMCYHVREAPLEYYRHLGIDDSTQW